MAALGCPSQMKPSASSICTHFVHYSWAKKTTLPSILLHHSSHTASRCDTQHFLKTSLQAFRLLSLVMLSQHLCTSKYLCAVIHKANSPSGLTLLCVWECVCVSLGSRVFQHLNKNGDCITSRLIKRPFPATSVSASACACLHILNFIKRSLLSD